MIANRVKTSHKSPSKKWLKQQNEYLALERRTLALPAELRHIIYNHYIEERSCDHTRLTRRLDSAVWLDGWSNKVIRVKRPENECDQCKTHVVRLETLLNAGTRLSQDILRAYIDRRGLHLHWRLLGRVPLMINRHVCADIRTLVLSGSIDLTKEETMWQSKVLSAVLFGSGSRLEELRVEDTIFHFAKPSLSKEHQKQWNRYPFLSNDVKARLRHATLEAVLDQIKMSAIFQPLSEARGLRNVHVSGLEARIKHVNWDMHLMFTQCLPAPITAHVRGLLGLSEKQNHAPG